MWLFNFWIMKKKKKETFKKKKKKRKSLRFMRQYYSYRMCGCVGNMFVVKRVDLIHW